MKVLSLTAIAAVFGISLTATAGIQNPEVDGNELTAEIELTPGISADLTLRFEKAIGLSAENIGLSVTSVSTLDSDLLERLPDPTAITIPGSFPVLLTIAPPADGGFAFEGLAEVELYTHNLQFTAETPLRLFSAAPGEDFRDITDSVSGGSYRTRGSTGSFSDFLIVADTRLLPAVVNTKFDRLQAILDQAAGGLDSALYTELQTAFQDAKAAWNNGNLPAAISAIEDFESTVKQAGGSDIPNVWRSARDLDNVAGRLRAAATTLRFSLALASNLA